MINKTLISEKDYIVYDFNLPDHTSDLARIEDIISKIRSKLETITTNKTINNANHLALFEETVKVLLNVGGLSQPVFEIGDEMEAMYTQRYKHAPSLGKQLYLGHYEGIHHPYDILKNRCFKLLGDLDKLYAKTHKKCPPNWKL